ncbi:MAG: hypothetical protein CYG61_06175 [Actinobacteria bacterium]|nr:MAG: hypothetical protein CYG61_06175 [Actinomycetota bacterium]
MPYTHLDGPHRGVQVGELKIGLIAAQRRPHLTNSVLGDPRVSDQEWARREGMVAFAGYPLVAGRRLVGVMAVFARHALSPSALTMLASIADQVAVGVHQDQLFGELRTAEASQGRPHRPVGSALPAAQATGRGGVLDQRRRLLGCGVGRRHRGGAPHHRHPPVRHKHHPRRGLVPGHQYGLAVRHLRRVARLRGAPGRVRHLRHGLRAQRPARMTQGELAAHPGWRGFGAEAGRHPPMRGWLAAPLTAPDGGDFSLSCPTSTAAQSSARTTRRSSSSSPGSPRRPSTRARCTKSGRRSSRLSSARSAPARSRRSHASPSGAATAPTAMAWPWAGTSTT